MIEAATEYNLSQPVPAVSYRVKIMYGLGDIANAIKVVIFALYSLFFATAVMGLPGTWIGITGFIAMFWDAIIDPYIGYLTDKKNASARRFNSMLLGAFAMGISFWAFFSPPSWLSGLPLLAWLFIFSLIVRSATSMYSIPYYAVGANLTQDYNERTSITGVRGMIGIIGTSLAASLSFVLFFPDKVPGVDPKLNHSGYASMGLTFGLTMTVVALIAIAGTLFLKKRLGSDAIPNADSSGKFVGSMWQSLQNPSFRLLFLSFSLVVLGLAVNSSLLLHYLKYYVKVNGSVALSHSQIAFYGGGLVGMGLWLRVSRHFDKHRLYVLSAGLTSLFTLAALPLFGEGHPLGTGNIRSWLIAYGIAGFFASILWFIPQSMLADVADESELLTGKRSEGALFGMFSFGQQVSAGIAVLLAGVLLDHFVKLSPGPLNPSATTVYRIGVVYSVVPSALFLAAAVTMLNYKLTRSRVNSMQAELQLRRIV